MKIKNICLIFITLMLSGCLGATVAVYPRESKNNSAIVFVEYLRNGDYEDMSRKFAMFGDIYVQRGSACDDKWKKLSDGAPHVLTYLPANEIVNIKIELKNVTGGGAAPMYVRYATLISAFKFKPNHTYKISTYWDFSNNKVSEEISEVDFVDGYEEKINSETIFTVTSTNQYIKNQKSEPHRVQLIKCKN